MLKYYCYFHSVRKWEHLCVVTAISLSQFSSSSLLCSYLCHVILEFFPYKPDSNSKSSSAQPPRKLLPVSLGCHLKSPGSIWLSSLLCHCLVINSCLTLLRPHGLEPARLLCSSDSPGKNAGVGCHFLLKGIFSAQGSNLHLLLGKQILYHWTTSSLSRQLISFHSSAACF